MLKWEKNISFKNLTLKITFNYNDKYSCSYSRSSHLTHKIIYKSFLALNYILLIAIMARSYTNTTGSYDIFINDILLAEFAAKVNQNP